MKFGQAIKNKNGKYHVCFIGPTSCGKSTLLNNLFNLKLPIGLGSTTKEATLIKNTNT
jgi:GTPase Era involved in 16S rRNA processing